jgi:hypothetical protein
VDDEVGKGVNVGEDLWQCVTVNYALLNEEGE